MCFLLDYYDNIAILNQLPTNWASPILIKLVLIKINFCDSFRIAIWYYYCLLMLTNLTKFHNTRNLPISSSSPVATLERWRVNTLYGWNRRFARIPPTTDEHREYDRSTVGASCCFRWRSSATDSLSEDVTEVRKEEGGRGKKED